MQLSASTSKQNTGLASLGTRLVAFALDALLLLTLVGVVDYYTFSSDESALLLKPERLLHLLLAWLYFAGTETCACQGTLGKHLLHLRVSDTSGNRLTFRASSIRFFTKPVTVLLTLLRFLVAAPLDFRRPFHDRVAGSQVCSR